MTEKTKDTIKSIWQIGEDGGGLGWNRWVAEPCLQRVREELSEGDLQVFDDLEYGGIIFVIEPQGAANHWDSIVQESLTLDEPEATYTDVLTQVKMAIEEEKMYRDMDD